jgi:Domain of unknown function (DUF1887)
MTVMISLVGEQSLPNFLPVQYYHPNDVLLIYSSKTLQKYEYLKLTLQKEVNVLGLETDAYDISTMARALNEELGKIAALISQPLVFNLTGGTKTMSLAAYQVAQQHNAPMMYLQSEGKHTRVYHYIWKYQQLCSTNNELLPECITLQDVFDLYLGPGNWQECGSGRSEGSPFEDALAATLRMHGYEVMIGVRAMNGQIDVDIAVRSGNQYGIIEAKMGKNGKKLDGIKQQLSTAARHLGTYSQTFYVITVPSQPAHSAITDGSNIQVVSLPSYDRTTNMLPTAEVTVLLDKIGKALKG